MFTHLLQDFAATLAMRIMAKVWALLSTDNGPVQYTGYADETLKRSSIKMGSNDFDSKRTQMLEGAQADGFKDLTGSNLPLYPWDGEAGAYRGTKAKKCAVLKSGKSRSKKSCMKSPTCSWRKGVYKKSKSGKIKKVLRKASCAKKSSKKSKPKSSKKPKKSTKKKSTKKKASRCNTLKSGKKKSKKACKKSKKKLVDCWKI